MKKNYLFTSESVSEGHPDKVCDRISDMVVDTYLSSEPQSRVACETLTTTNKVVLAGETRGPDINKDDLEELTTSLEQIMNQDGPIFVAIKVPAEVENLPIGMRERRATRSRSQTINDLRSELKIS